MNLDSEAIKWLVIIIALLGLIPIYKFIGVMRKRHQEQIRAEIYRKQSDRLLQRKSDFDEVMQETYDDFVHEANKTLAHSNRENVSLRTHANNVLTLFKDFYGPSLMQGLIAELIVKPDDDFAEAIEWQKTALTTALETQSVKAFVVAIDVIDKFSTQKNFQSIATDMIKAISEVFGSTTLNDKTIQRHRDRLHYNDRCEALSRAIFQGFRNVVANEKEPIRINRLLLSISSELYDDQVTILADRETRRRIAEEQRLHAKNRQQRSRRMRRRNANGRTDRR